jgi:hypothetical protein
MSQVFGSLIDMWPLPLIVALLVLYFGWKKLAGKLGVFVMMIGGAIVGFFVSVLLHNAIYAALFVTLLDKPDFDEPVFFIIAVIVCPIVFVVGVVGSLVMWLRQKRQPGQA